MSESQLLERIEKMTSAMTLMASMLGTRLDRGQLAERMGVHRNTLAKRMCTDKSFPRPGKDGKWLLSEVIQWEKDQ
jgi:predicted DNA-binding transcriptional regulator AlpA